MDISAAITRYLMQIEQPVITDYDLCMAFFNFREVKKYHGESIHNLPASISLEEACNDIIEKLINLGIMSINKDFSGGSVFQISGKTYSEPGDIACSVDPFAYVSHISAMEFHGLTNRLPKILFISTPPAKEWAKFARHKMERDCHGSLNEYLRFQLPKLTNVKFDKIQKTQITRYSSIHQGAFKKIGGRKLRVSTIGRTFLDMLRRPDYCGGMRHVMDVFGSFGAQYKKLIIDEIDGHGNAIEQARAGFILEEKCDIRDETIEAWAKRVQRGGSRKLDPQGTYSEIFSERWCLSINTD